ncbi:hypothetical protein INT45_012475 [Circinella minor]|uniref:Uncharacterized protein n=1 Tax=Circinella minor TaxID=1195481 RepID=A0A8H7VF71_9FUNG|nr:hypothetical protein INT45_012475 [Circinella minor]
MGAANYDRFANKQQGIFEKDIITRIWRLIDNSMTPLLLLQEQLNTSRSISGNGLNDWITVWKPDLLLIEQEIEYGVAEHGGYDEACAGKKELFEKWLKLPKLIKDMFCRAAHKVNHEKEYLWELKVAGF